MFHDSKVIEQTGKGSRFLPRIINLFRRDQEFRAIRKHLRGMDDLLYGKVATYGPSERLENILSGRSEMPKTETSIQINGKTITAKGAEEHRFRVALAHAISDTFNARTQMARGLKEAQLSEEHKRVVAVYLAGLGNANTITALNQSGYNTSLLMQEWREMQLLRALTQHI